MGCAWIEWMWGVKRNGCAVSMGLGGLMGWVCRFFVGRTETGLRGRLELWFCCLRGLRGGMVCTFE